jgi:hypothetical protein
LNQKGIQQCPRLIRQRSFDNGNQRPVMAIDGPQDQHRKSQIARDLDLLSNEHFDGAGENQLRFQL